MVKVISECWGLPLQILALLAMILVQHSIVADASFCGKSRSLVTTYILHGEHVHPGEWPWHVAVFDRQYELNKTISYICGGSIISKDFVLSAAHCFKDDDPNRYFLKAGVHWLHNDTDPSMVMYNLSEIIVHPNYRKQNVIYHYDIALIRPDREILFNAHDIFPICLWPEHDLTFIDIFKQSGTVVGFGRTETHKISEVLLKKSFDMMEKSSCIKKYLFEFRHLHEKDGTLCGLGMQDNVAVCKGDSGGGLYFRENNVWYLRGIVSSGSLFQLPSGHLTCDPTVPSIYTDVTQYISWINEHVRTVDHPNLLELEDCGVDGNAKVEYEMQKPVFNQYPWNVLLEVRHIVTKKIYLVCNGVLVHPRYVLTVGHCVDEGLANFKLHSVRLGEYDILLMDDRDPNNQVTPIRYQSVDIEQVFFKYKYQGPIYTNNLALLKLKQNADTSKPNIKPICLPIVDDYKESSLTLTGWKRNKEKFPQLEREAMNLSSTATCNREYEKLRVRLPASDNMVCAEYRDRPKGHCYSFASGSPLQYIKPVDKVPRYFLAGLMVFNFPRCHTQGSEIFLSVASAAQWIKDTVKRK